MLSLAPLLAVVMEDLAKQQLLLMDTEDPLPPPHTPGLCVVRVCVRACPIVLTNLTILYHTCLEVKFLSPPNIFRVKFFENVPKLQWK